MPHTTGILDLLESALRKDDWGNDGLLHASTDLVGPLRHTMLRMAGAPELPESWASLVTLQIGVNNQYRGRPAQDYREQFAALLSRAIRLAGDRAARVVVVSIPDWGVTRFAREQARDRALIASELDAYNAIAEDEARRAGVHFVDITGISRAHPELVADDGLHPSAAQYSLWLGPIEAAVRAALR